MKFIAAIVATIVAPFVGLWVGILMIPEMWRDIYSSLKPKWNGRL